jgi:hypothetical protein
MCEGSESDLWGSVDRPFVPMSHWHWIYRTHARIQAKHRCVHVDGADGRCRWQVQKLMYGLAEQTCPTKKCKRLHKGDKSNRRPRWDSNPQPHG